MIKCDVKEDRMGNITVHPVAKRHNYPSLFFQEGSHYEFLESLPEHTQKAISVGWEVRVLLTDEYFMDSDYEEHLMEILPHGSGIDCDWEFSEQKDGKLVCKNSYHVMNDAGYYMGFIDFSIRFHRNRPGNFILQFHTNKTGYWWIERTNLRTYLDDTLYEALQKFEA